MTALDLLLWTLAILAALFAMLVIGTIVGAIVGVVYDFCLRSREERW